jgi:cytoplasmic tRNA 2-thiolation protein 1
MAPCALCEPSSVRRAILRRPKTGQGVCRECFFLVFETEVHNTIMRHALFKRGEKVGVAASGGKGESV